ncbi:unnamed protein product, partial [Choristocarpus tenellus]
MVSECKVASFDVRGCHSNGLMWDNEVDVFSLSFTSSFKRCPLANAALSGQSHDQPTGSLRTSSHVNDPLPNIVERVGYLVWTRLGEVSPPLTHLARNIYSHGIPYKQGNKWRDILSQPFGILISNSPNTVPSGHAPRIPRTSS